MDAQTPLQEFEAFVEEKFAKRKLDDERIRRMASTDFSAFRRYIRPDMLTNWWTDDIADHLQQFYEAFARGERPWLAIEAPPQHGKSWAATDFIAYIAGRNPNWKSIFGSYSDDLGVRTNLD